MTAIGSLAAALWVQQIALIAMAWRLSRLSRPHITVQLVAAPGSVDTHDTADAA